jgi:DNA-binding transcriptional LysR family regulator/tetratricopeptide (TPR) repeat protein
LLAVWNWLPAFQVVAETQHLPSASERLHVSVSALSRTIKLLESTLGRPLFRRIGRTLELNAEGVRLQAAVEGALSALLGDFDRLGGEAGGGALHIGTAGPLSQGVVVPALREVQARLPGLVPYLNGCAPAEALRLLRKRSLDLVLLSEAQPAAGVTLEFLGEFGNGVFCGRSHPLYGVAQPAADEVLQHEFVAYHQSAESRAQPWPKRLARKVAIYVDQDDTLLELCLTGRLLAVLPEVVAAPHVERGALKRLPVGGLVATPLYAAWRAADGAGERIGAIVRAARAHLDSLRVREPQPATATPPMPPPRPPASWELGDSLLQRAEYSAALQAYRATRRQLAPLHPDEKSAYHLRLAQVALKLGRYRDATRACQTARAAATTAAGAAQAEATCVLAYCFTGELNQAQKWLDRARARLERPGATDGAEGQRALALTARAEGNLLLALGQPARAVTAYASGAKISEALGDRWEHSIALFNIAEARLHGLDHTRAQLELDRAAVEKEAIGDRWGLGYVHHARGLLHLLAGEIAQARVQAAAGLKLAVGVADAKLSAMLHLLLGRALLAAGELADAERAFRFALRTASGSRTQVELIQAQLGLTDVHLRSGSPARAARSASQALARARAEGGKDAQAAALAASAAVHAQRGDDADAARLLRAARALAPDLTRLYGTWFTVAA